MNEFLDLPTIIFLAIAVFVLIKLRSVLGTRTGNERDPSTRIKEIKEKIDKPAADNDDKIVPLRPTGARKTNLHKRSENPKNPHPVYKQSIAELEAEKRQLKFEAQAEKLAFGDKNLIKGFNDIGKLDADFMPKEFFEGAKSAYEMVVTAFANGDKTTLKNLLAKDVYDGFESAIRQREKDNLEVDFTFVGLPKVEFASAEVEKNTAFITIKFYAEVVSATRDKEGNLIEGNADQIANIADSWTFARSTKSKDPNWKLVATDQLN